MAIKAVIFDMGGVLIDLDIAKSWAEFKRIGFNEIELYLNRYHQMGIFGKLEGGEVNEQEFFEGLATYCRPGTTVDQMRYAFLSALGGIDPYKFDMLRDLKKKYKLYVLSNNNILTYKGFHAMLKEGGLPAEEIFDDTFYSFRIGLQKPSPEIYRYVIDKIGFLPGEILFVDDSEKNIDAAAESGIKVALYCPEENLAELVARSICSLDGPER